MKKLLSFIMLLSPVCFHNAVASGNNEELPSQSPAAELTVASSQNEDSSVAGADEANYGYFPAFGNNGNNGNNGNGGNNVSADMLRGPFVFSNLSAFFAGK
ncbi:MAG: hypothetical protein LBG13_02455 [Holosporales bacterium]|jgi:hypothetical protein|nr:hypothetical protein [Holosporales bacterium]